MLLFLISLTSFTTSRLPINASARLEFDLSTPHKSIALPSIPFAFGIDGLSILNFLNSFKGKIEKLPSFFDLAFNY